MTINRAMTLLAFVLSSTVATAAAPKHHDLSPSQLSAIRENNLSVNKLSSSSLPAPARPFSELESAGFLFFSVDEDFDSLSAKQEMIKNLPDGVEMVLYADPGSSKADIMRDFGGLIAPERLHIIELRNASQGFWSRDGMPVPALSTEGSLDLVDAKYYYSFEPDKEVAKYLKAGLLKHSYNFEGGNFMTNDNGACIVVNNDETQAIPDSAFSSFYGCKNLLRLPFIKGIGHADESVKFVGTNLVLTDSTEYKKLLEAHGYQVKMLPRPSNEYETYVNSLLVNGTIYVPIFNQKTDDEALNVYREVGLKVVGIPTVSLSNDGEGSLHCITMTYPKLNFADLVQKLGAREL